MKKPEPQVGLVIRYDFLWSHERDRGLEDGAKHRLCVVVTAVLRKSDGASEVLVAPITHTPPAGETPGIEIPYKVGENLGLDDARSYIIADECNTLSWDDPGIVPVAPGVQWAYGRLPKALYDQLRTAMLNVRAARKLKATRRS